MSISNHNNLFFKFINFLKEFQYQNFKEITHVNICKDIESCIKFLQDSSYYINNCLTEKEQQEIIALLIYNNEYNFWGPSIFQNNKIKLNNLVLDKKLLLKFFQAWLYREVLRAFYDVYALKTHNIYIMLLGTENYPSIDLIVIDKSINYQEMNLEELKQLTTIRNKNEMYLVYFIGGFCSPTFETEKNLQPIISNPIIYSRIYLNSLNKIILITKKNIHLYTLDLKETREFYNFPESYLKTRTEPEAKKLGQFLIENSISSGAFLTLTDNNNNFCRTAMIAPTINQETKFFMQMLEEGKLEYKIILFFFRSRFYKIYETFREIKNFFIRVERKKNFLKI